MKLSYQHPIKKHNLADLQYSNSTPSITKGALFDTALNLFQKIIINTAGSFHFKLTFKESFHTLF